MADQTTRTTTSEPASVGEVIDSVKTYVRQETVGPLKGAGTWIGYGAAGALCLGLGLSILLLGLLRVLQTESIGAQSERWTWLNYLVVAVVCALFIGLAVWRINQTFLNKEDQS